MLPGLEARTDHLPTAELLLVALSDWSLTREHDPATGSTSSWSVHGEERGMRLDPPTVPPALGRAA
jgi:hypothetical protein